MRASKSTVKIGLRSNHLTSNGKRTVCIQYLAHRQSIYISLNIIINPKEWNYSSMTIRKTVPFADKYNKIILEAYHKANTILLENYYNPLSIKDFIDTFKNNKRQAVAEQQPIRKSPIVNVNDHSYNPAVKKRQIKESSCFYDFILKEIELLKPTRAKGTIDNYYKFVNALKRWKSKLTFDEINIELVQKYHNHEIKSGNLLSTIYKKHANFKFLLGIAIDKEMLEKNPYQKFEIKKITKAQNNDILSEIEIQKLQKAYDDNNYTGVKKEVLRAFLFSCYTGISFSDINNIYYSNLHSIQIDKEEYLLLRNDRVKTAVTYKIPIVSPIVLALVGSGKAKSMIFRTLENHVWSS